MTRPLLASLIMLNILVSQAEAQESNKETVLKREVTLYNPYKPSLTVIKKLSFLPDMSDTAKVKPEFRYTVSAEAFKPEYTISPIKAAAVVPDPLPKLYKSFVNLGFGNHITPLAEISITNERSKKGSYGFYGRHFSMNDDIELQNAKEVYGGSMDNDASLFGRRLFGKSALVASVNYSQKIRHAYGYDPEIVDYSPSKDDIKLNYTNIWAKAVLSSQTLDSSKLAYDFALGYNYFREKENYYQHHAEIKGVMSKSTGRFYIGSGLDFDYDNNADSIGMGSDIIASISPFLKKSTEQWNFKLGLKLLLDHESFFHLYPDVEFGFSIIQRYLGFFASLSGDMKRNHPWNIISENPYLLSDQFPDFAPSGTLFRLPDTNHKFVVNSGLKGNTGIGGNYVVSASYSIIDDMIFFSNLVFPDTISPRAMGNYFLPIDDNVKLLNLHAEMDGPVTHEITYNWAVNYYDYSTGEDYAWNKPAWDGRLGLKYNLRDKIIAGLELAATGKRKAIVNGDVLSKDAGYISDQVSIPAHFNLNITAEYRYSKILSFWTRLNNISFDRYYEWAYYPTQKFIFMAGFTYSL